ncbi:MAG: 50S ribosomal protein L25 [Bacteroidales bacterium]|nr:50S ribosomal protein L25 [Bacteroidales bacterium]
MKTVSMSGSLRENVGKKDAKMNRKLGKVPCVLYGGKEQIHFIADEKDFVKIIFTPEVFIIKLSINTKEYNAVLQDVQYHPVTDKILHVDFLEILSGKPVIIGLPVVIEGSAIGVLGGGQLVKKIRKLKVKALVEHLPDNIILDITNLDIGDSIRVKDIQRKNLEFLDIPNAEIVGVKVTKVAEIIEEVSEEVGEEAEEGEEEGTKETPKGAEKKPVQEKP